MSDAPTAREEALGVSAGRLLREARQAKGLHVAVLASAIKVAPRKLEALEADRYEELPDATFTRALAQTVCRTLKIDAAPVLALLPRAGGQGLGHLGDGLNTPFREGSGQPSDGGWSMLARPAVWAPIGVLLIAAAVYLAPARWFEFGGDLSEAQAPTLTTGASTSVRPGDRAVSRVEALPSAATPAPASGAASAGPVDRSETVGPGRAATEQQLGASAASPAALAGASSSHGIAPTTASSLASASGTAGELRGKTLELRAARDSWIEVLDASGQTLLSRTLKTGETVELEGALPLRVRIGNAAYTEVTFRGQPLPLAPYTRANLARLELK
jgi:cytoskeleton protein RodZ